MHCLWRMNLLTTANKNPCACACAMCILERQWVLSQSINTLHKAYNFHLEKTTDSKIVCFLTHTHTHTKKYFSPYAILHMNIKKHICPYSGQTSFECIPAPFNRDNCEILAIANTRKYLVISHSSHFAQEKSDSKYWFYRC